MRRLLTLAVALASVSLAQADVILHPIFGDHMVLQRGPAATIWGKAEPGETVVVQFDRSEGGKSDVVMNIAKADEKGFWKTTIGPMTVGKPGTLYVAGKNEIKCKNVLVGDVWVCSGQSNMQWEFWRLTRDDQGKKVSAAATNPNIRLMTIPRRPSAKPEYDFPVTSQTRKEGDKTFTANFGKWEECNPASVYEFSAVGYYFGRDIAKAQNVPVGLIADNWGGTPAQAWTSEEKLNSIPELAYYHADMKKAMESYDPAKAEAAYQAALTKWNADAAKAKEEGKAAPRRPVKQGPPSVNQNSPSALYNGMIHPILPLAIKGAIWYQGESNAGKAREYYVLYPAMIEDWRARWKNPLPFFGVQLAPFRADGNEKVSYAELRDSQFYATKKLKDVGIAIITDVGEETDIHPQLKEPVGQRLALSARAIAYGEKVEYLGPEYKSHTIDGDKVVVQFVHAKGLMIKGNHLNGFTMCGEDKQFYPATAEIKGDTVVVKCEKVSKPVAVRFGWVNFAKPDLNLFNGAGLPAVPFRTDDFPLTTQFPGKK